MISPPPLYIPTAPPPGIERRLFEAENRGTPSDMGKTGVDADSSVGQKVSLVATLDSDPYTEQRLTGGFMIRIAVGAEAVRDRNDPLGAIKRKIDGFRYLAPNWDSYDGVPTTGKAIRAAHLLLRTLGNDPRLKEAEQRLHPYCVAPLGYGGVQLEWKGPGGLVEVEIEDDGTYELLVKSANGAKASASGVRVGIVLNAVREAVSP